MLIFSEYLEQLKPSASLNDIKSSTQTANLLGFKIYYIPAEDSFSGDLKDALWHIPIQSLEQMGIWIGYIPTAGHYENFFNVLAQKKIRLVNTPKEHLRVQEFDQTYPFIKELTARSRIVKSVDECEKTIEELGLPVFVKGAIQSKKSDGWKACVAENLDELKELTKNYLKSEHRTRGRVVVREILKLRHRRKTAKGFPIGREYRVFIYKNKILGVGYYWEGEDELKELKKSEEYQVRELALKASEQLNVPYLTVDIGQLENEKWIIIETGDAQFSGISQVSLLKLWNEIKNLKTLK